MPLLLSLAASVLLAAAGVAAPADSGASPYAEGQVWHYRTRKGEDGSVLAIRRIETVEAFAARGPVFHISVIGVKIGPNIGSALPHLPVSRETLDASVTRLAEGKSELPPFDEGIAEWRAARGGVFTISIAEIVSAAEQLLSRAPLD